MYFYPEHEVVFRVRFCLGQYDQRKKFLNGMIRALEYCTSDLGSCEDFKNQVLVFIELFNSIANSFSGNLGLIIPSFLSPKDRTKTTQELFCMFGFKHKKLSVDSFWNVRKLRYVRFRQIWYVWFGTFGMFC